MTHISIKQIFLGWDRPLIDLAVERISSDVGIADGILDYSKVLFFLPTSRSCRRFRREITQYAVANSAVVFPGRIKTFSSLISNIESRDDVINSSASFLLWCEVLREAPLEALGALFPLAVENQNDIRWRIGLAEKIFSLQNQLGENGLTICDVADMDVEEADRWRDLAELEKRYLACLKEHEFTELNRAKKQHNEFSFPEIEKIIVAGVPDPIPLLVEKLKIISEKIPVEIWIHAPESESNKFDEFGRPSEKYWHDAHIEIPDESWIHLEGTSRQQGEEVVNILKKLQNVEVPSSEFRVPSSEVGKETSNISPAPAVLPAGEHPTSNIEFDKEEDNTSDLASNSLKSPAPGTPCSVINADDFAICIANEELYSDISYAFFKQGIHVYNPSGTKMDGMSVYHLLRNFSDLVNKCDFETASQLLRNPDYLRYFIKKYKVENILEIFREVDDYLVDHMSKPVHSLPEFEEETALNYLFCEVKRLIEEFKTGNFFGFIRGFLSDIYESIELSPHTREEDHIFCSAAKQVDDLLKELDSPYAEKIYNPELLEVFIKLLGKGNVYPERPEDSLDLQGWLEISWENAPNIIISGMNEGWLPESVVGDVFLPDSMLSKLGLTDNRKRFARDTYILHSLLKSRRGSVQMIVGKQNKSSDPVKPSRLLFKCDEERLVERSEHLFSDLPEDIQEKTQEGDSWQLKKPDLTADIKRISVTEFRNYLACPFRFYLRKCLEMEDVVYENNEMDARDFGTITHEVLEDFARDETMLECSDQKAIKKFIDNGVEKHFNKKFGPKDERPLPIMVQYESLKQRLAKFAEIQAEQVAQGWKIVETELKIGGEMNGIYISGKIDRVEINSRNGNVRILDYKTVDSSDFNKILPDKTHVKSANDIVPYYTKFDFDGKEKCWMDLQLPLYAILLKHKEQYRDRNIECGYFNLHKTVSYIDIYLWRDMYKYLEPAEECVKKVLENINNQVFWPPTEKVQYENYGRIYAGFKTLKEAFE